MNTPLPNQIIREITPLSDKDCFYIAERYKTEFTYPIHQCNRHCIYHFFYFFHTLVSLFFFLVFISLFLNIHVCLVSASHSGTAVCKLRSSSA